MSKAVSILFDNAGIFYKKEVNNTNFPTIISLGVDVKRFDFVIKTPPTAILLIEASKVKKGSDQPNRNKVGSVTWDQVKTIAETKMPDLNCFTIESAMSMVAGTAANMGLNVTGEKPY